MLDFINCVIIKFKYQHKKIVLEKKGNKLLRFYGVGVSKIVCCYYSQKKSVGCH